MAAKKTSRKLPANVKESDLKYDYKAGTPYEKLREMGNVPASLTFYKTNDRWVLTTLHISNPSRSNRAKGITAARTYSIGVDDKKIYTVGRGPHVTDEITVYVTNDNIERLMPMLELWVKGMAEAGTIRDRTSSRRAMGALHRANGRTSWMW